MGIYEAFKWWPLPFSYQLHVSYLHLRHFLQLWQASPTPWAFDFQQPASWKKNPGISCFIKPCVLLHGTLCLKQRKYWNTDMRYWLSRGRGWDRLCDMVLHSEPRVHDHMSKDWQNKISSCHEELGYGHFEALQENTFLYTILPPCKKLQCFLFLNKKMFLQSHWVQVLTCWQGSSTVVE